MDATPTLWLVSLVVLVTVIGLDLALAVRRPHAVSTREASAWTVFYVSLAVIFGGWLWFRYGADIGGQFYAGYLTEYSLSVDNLFVFVIIMSRFRVPRENQQYVLLVGIILALIMRAIFIVIGASAIERFSWVFYLFGAFWSTPRSSSSCTPRASPRSSVRTGSSAGCAGAADIRPVRRQPAADVHRRPPPLHPVAARHGGDRHHRPAVRPRLDPGHLRAHPGAVSRLHRKRVRADGAPTAVLPARRLARPARLPRYGLAVVLGSSGSSSCWRRSTRTRCRLSTGANPFVGAGDQHAGEPDRDRDRARCHHGREPGSHPARSAVQ